MVRFVSGQLFFQPRTHVMAYLHCFQSIAILSENKRYSTTAGIGRIGAILPPFRTSWIGVSCHLREAPSAVSNPDRPPSRYIPMRSSQFAEKSSSNDMSGVQCAMFFGVAAI
jgi:hypothetical protein